MSAYNLDIVRQFPPPWIHPKIGPYTGVIVPVFIELNAHTTLGIKRNAHATGKKFSTPYKSENFYCKVDLHYS